MLIKLNAIALDRINPELARCWIFQITSTNKHFHYMESFENQALISL